MSTLNGYQMVEQWLPASFSKQTAMRCKESSLSRLDMSASDVVTAACNVARKPSIGLGRAAWASSVVPRRENHYSSIRWMKVIQSTLDVERNFQYNFASNHCRTSSPECALVASCRSHNLCLTAGDVHLQAAPTAQFPGNHDIVQQSASHVANRVPQTPMLKLTWHPSRGKQRIICYPEITALTLNSPSREKHVSPVHSSSAVSIS
jgi:hypothetical protein